MSGSLKRVSKTSTLINQLNKTKDHLNVDGDSDDCRLTDTIEAATDFIERATGKIFTETTWDWVLPEFPGDSIEFPQPPLKSITSITYYNSNNGSTTLSSTAYDIVQPYNQPGFIEVKSGNVFPVTYDRPDAVTIRFVSGYTELPPMAKHLANCLVDFFNENRGSDMPDFPEGICNMIHLLKNQRYV